MRLLVTILLSSALAVIQAISTAWGQENSLTQLPETVVTGTPETGSLTTPTTAESRTELDRVPGGTTVVDQELIHDRAQQGVEEVLSFAPGVYAESFDNGADARISIRGSGILQGAGFISGVRLLRDGLPLTRALGYANAEQVDLLSISHLEVYRGANALEYGAATLGGAINFVSPTGYTADRLRVGMRGGSDTYLRPYFSSGGVLGNGFDYYVSGSGVDTDGFRRRDSFNHEWYAGANLGYRSTDRHETRVFFNFSDQRYGVPGPLFQRELEEDPARVTDAFCPGCRNREQFYRVALTHTAQLRERDRLEVGASYLLYPGLVST
ncbi:MAG: TonB-dependent receptor plug domain-containing protein, partial [Candidatus Binatia bacterium]